MAAILFSSCRRPRRRCGVVAAAMLLSVFAAACAGSGSDRGRGQRPREDARYDSPNYDPGQGAWGERYPIELVALPAIWLRSDVADRLAPQTVAPDSLGAGLGVRAAVGNIDQSIGILYHGALLSGEDGDDGGDADLHAFYFDADARIPIREAPRGFFVRAAAGLGIGSLDYADGRFRDARTGAGNVRFALEYEPPGSGWALMVGAGGFVIGRPGDTDAFGTWLEFGGRITL
ncbi:MAG: hypothetical protein AB8H80_05800 [Planctomycetota bacterium]